MNQKLIELKRVNIPVINTQFFHLGLGRLIDPLILRLSDHLDSDYLASASALFFVFLCVKHCGCGGFFSGSVHYLQDPETSFFNKTFIKNGSYCTVSIFKIYFVTVFSVFIF